MLLRHSGIYLLARGIPALINFAAIALYTRWLSPAEYGLYALAMATVGFVSAVGFNWLRLGLSRFFPQHEHASDAFLGTVLAGFVSMSSVFAVLAFIAGGLSDTSHPWLFALIFAVLITQNWFDLSLELARIRIKPVLYGVMSTVRSVAAVALGAVLIHAGYHAFGLLIGLAVSFVLSSAVFSRSEWRSASFSQADRSYLRKMANYGVPLTLTFALTFVVTTSDRFMLDWLLGKDSVGVYAAGYDFAQHSIIVLMSIVNLAAYPLAVRAFEKSGAEAASRQLEHNLTLLLATSLPAALGMAVCAPNVAEVFFGDAFKHNAAELIPWVALASMFWGMKAFFADTPFHLSAQTRGLLWVNFSAALANILLNLVWIPKFGILGAAYSTAASYVGAYLLSMILGRSLFRLPRFNAEHLKIGAAAVIMVVALMPIRGELGKYWLLTQVAVGVVSYTLAILLLDVASIRQWLVRTLGKSTKATDPA